MKRKKLEYFIKSFMESKAASAEQVTQYQIYLIGLTPPFPVIGFPWFLKSVGFSDPQISDFSSTHVGQYWEYLIQHHGGIHSGKAMRALGAFWQWCYQNKYLRSEMPSDLKFGFSEPDHPFLFHINLTQK